MKYCLSSAVLCLLAGGIAAAAEPPVLTAAQMREDLTVLREKMGMLDRSFDKAQRRHFEQLVADAAQSADQLNAAQFELAVSRAVAVARNGHTTAFIGRYLHTLPIRVWWFRDGLYVVKAHPDYSYLVGARVGTFGSMTAEEALSGTAPYISGTDSAIRAKSVSLLITPELLHEIGAAPTLDHVNMTFTLRDGSRSNVDLDAHLAPDPEPRRDYYAALTPSNASLPGRWPHVLDGVAKRPLIYQPDVDLYTEWLQTDPGVLYLRSNRILGTRQNRYGLMEKLVGVLHGEIAPKSPPFVIFDLRLNTGGDFFNTIAFTQALPAMLPPNGRIYVLVGPVTFSAALVTAALLRDHGKQKVQLVGEPMGDAETFWSEGASFELPNSHLGINPAMWKWSLRKPCADAARCYFAATVLGPHGVNLKPDISVAPLFAEYAAGRDPVMERVLKQVRKKP